MAFTYDTGTVTCDCCGSSLTVMDNPDHPSYEPDTARMITGWQAIALGWHLMIVTVAHHTVALAAHCPDCRAAHGEATVSDRR
jgi:hypothetical protein